MEQEGFCDIICLINNRSYAHKFSPTQFSKSELEKDTNRHSNGNAARQQGLIPRKRNITI